MPVREIRFDAGSLAEQEIAPSGAVINGITLLNVPAGVEPFIRLGNNPRIGPFVNPQPIDFGSDVDPADVTEGAYMSVDVATPGAVVGGFVSYRSSGAGTPASVAPRV